MPQIPEDAKGSFFPVANATEALFLCWSIITRPTKEDFRQLLDILRHPQFRIQDIPSEAALEQMLFRLPLLPGYHLHSGMVILPK